MYDAIDCQLLDVLQRDSSLALDAMSERVGLSRNACWRRIRRLEEDGVIRARVTLLDAAKINVGLPVFITLKATEHSPKWLAQFSTAVKGIPEIVGVYRMSGDIDYLLHAVVPDVANYDRIYQRLIKAVSLADVSSSFVMETIKSTTVLPLTYAPSKANSG